MYIEKGEIFGSWNTVWEYLYEEIKEAPEVTEKGLKIMLMVIKQINTFFSSFLLCSLLLKKKKYLNVKVFYLSQYFSFRLLKRKAILANQ